ncbi:uncharacterized protein LOC125251885 [Megalobrama amblycephala]|uniref:uncharacterized protein LOC125251885 n=1 Tax=Megalobrama amblycephala TaxID=75352 RepID=UPI002013C72F|nr:uncharacterized protein LOC125251885 [Megalobrama amblycephala]
MSRIQDNIELIAFDYIDSLAAAPDSTVPDKTSVTDEELVHIDAQPEFIDLTQAVNNSDEELIHLVTQPGFIDLTRSTNNSDEELFHIDAQPDFIDLTQNTNNSDDHVHSLIEVDRLRAETPISTTSRAVDITSSDVIDLTFECNEPAAGVIDLTLDCNLPPRKRRKILEYRPARSHQSLQCFDDSSIVRTDEVPGPSNRAISPRPVRKIENCTPEQSPQSPLLFDVDSSIVRTDEVPGPSNRGISPRPVRKIENCTPEQSPQSPLLFDDDHDSRVNDLSEWSESQINAWDDASWTGSQYDEATVRGRQTPYPFHNQAVVEVEEHPAEHIHNEVTSEDWRFILTLINRLIVQNDELRARVDVYVNDVHTRIDAFVNEIHNLSHPIVHDVRDRMIRFFNDVCDRLDAQENRIQELGGIVYNQHHALETGFHVFQSSVNENFVRINNILNEELRERRLIVNLLCARNNVR